MNIRLPKFLESWKNNVILVACLVSLVICLVFLSGKLLGAWHEHSKAYAAMVKAREDYNQFILRQKEIPSNKLIKEYEEHGKELKKMYEDLYASFVSNKPSETTVTALEFKQHLLTVQREFQEQSEEKNIPIPLDLGFKELMGNQIPSEQSIPLLSLQLNLVSLLFDLLFQSNVERVDTMVKKSVISSGNFKRQLPFSVTFKTENRGLATFLNLLQAQKGLFIVENINVDTLPLTKAREDSELGHLLEVSVEITYAELK